MTNPFQSQRQIKPDYIIDVLVRGRWFLIIPLCISLTLGLGKTLTADKVYRARTLILVQPQRVPSNYIKSVVSSSINQRISTISQQVLSRSNLEQIIEQFGLFENSTGMYQEDKIRSLRKRIKVKNRHAKSFSISFSGRDPQTVMRIANTLSSYFMDENLKVREAQAMGTNEFLDAELDKTRRRLEEKEQTLANYRARYLGGLPDELETNLRTLDRLQKQATNKAMLLREVNKSISQLDSQISSMAATNDDFLNFGSDEFQGEDDSALQATEAKYERLLLRYTEKHPDVKKLKSIIEKLRKNLEAAKKEEQSLAESEEDILPNMGWNPAAPLKAQRAQLVVEANKIQAQISSIQKKMQIYQQRVEDTPKREIELQSLKRDYGNIRGIYNSLLKRKLEAELSVNLEKRQKGEQFRILDYARLPEKPVSPNVKIIFLLSVAGGLGLGGAVLFLKEWLTFSVIRGDDQIETGLGLPILASIPPLEKPDDKTKQRVERVIFICCCCYSAVFLIFFAILNYKGLDRTINFIKTTLNL